MQKNRLHIFKFWTYNCNCRIHFCDVSNVDGAKQSFYSMSVDGLLPKFLVIYMLQIEHLIKQIFFYGIR
jgi:hypothetical protein